MLIDSHWCCLGPRPGLGLRGHREKDKISQFQVSTSVKPMSKSRRDKGHHITEMTSEPGSDTEANRKVYALTLWLCDCGQTT